MYINNWFFFWESYKLYPKVMVHVKKKQLSCMLKESDINDSVHPNFTALCNSVPAWLLFYLRLGLRSLLLLRRSRLLLSLLLLFLSRLRLRDPLRRRCLFSLSRSKKGANLSETENWKRPETYLPSWRSLKDRKWNSVEKRRASNCSSREWEKDS